MFFNENVKHQSVECRNKNKINMPEYIHGCSMFVQYLYTEY